MNSIDLKSAKSIVSTYSVFSLNTIAILSKKHVLTSNIHSSIPHIQTIITITTNTKVARIENILIEGDENRFHLASFITITSTSTYESNIQQSGSCRRS